MRACMCGEFLFVFCFVREKKKKEQTLMCDAFQSMFALKLLQILVWGKVHATGYFRDVNFRVPLAFGKEKEKLQREWKPKRSVRILMVLVYSCIPVAHYALFQPQLGSAGTGEKCT